MSRKTLPSLSLPISYGGHHFNFLAFYNTLYFQHFDLKMLGCGIGNGQSYNIGKGKYNNKSPFIYTTQSYFTIYIWHLFFGFLFICFVCFCFPSLYLSLILGWLP